ncbi:efflux RND transporter permease subunit [Chitinophaga vietnamensis]|uniref:efflux RND transporter permease subunit n=1 Tax=Chitinophaga vietnamensis TaxID=2593957 RepID=UPI001177A0D6|nr:efflux RND transporter permease subunit [Chitinophaga vietnamensis]
MLRKFIERPVLSTVVSIILLSLGVISLLTLPITLFPDIAPPSVQVTANYPGANSEVVARAVATPIEEAVNGVENMSYMTSNSSNDGNYTLTVYFKQGTNPDINAVNVQNRVSKANSQLPQEVIQAGISTQKVQNSTIMFVGLQAFDTTKGYNELFLENYLRINLIPQLQRIPGVAQATVFSAKDYSMRIWLKPERLAANNLSPQDVMNAIRDQNIEAAPGRLGQGSSASFEYIIKYKGKLNKNEDYENMVLKSNNDGSVLRLKDVARIEFGGYSYTSTNKLSNKPTSGFAILQTPGSNANEILTEVQRQLKEFTPKLPVGTRFEIMYNVKNFLDASIDQVKETLIIAFILVALVVFVFLQDWRSTLIPVIAVPVAIVGTFFFMQLLGFTINLLTLFALVLAIGIVVDDAIVVVEAVHTKMARTHLAPKEATISAMSEISGAIVSITLVMAAVFVPVSFVQGPAGVFYKQFAFTIATAIIISAINALTLSPALCALLLKNHHADAEEEKKAGLGKRFFTAFNTGFNAMTDKYVGSIKFLLKNKWVAIAALLLVTLGSVVLMRNSPTGFIPNEDQGFVLSVVQTPAGSSLDRTTAATAQISDIIDKDPSTNGSWVINGFNLITFATSSPQAAIFSRLKPIKERGAVTDPDVIAGGLIAKTSQVHDAMTVFVNFPTVQGFGNVSGAEFTLQDRGDGSLQQLGNTAWAFIGELSKRKEIATAFTTFNTSNPQYNLEVDDIKAKQLGVSISDLMNTLQVYYGSSFVTDFNRFGKYYRVMAQADVPYRVDESSLDGIYVKNNLGTMVPVSTVAKFVRTYGPEVVTRNNLYKAVQIQVIPKPGYSTGDAIKAIQATAKQSLPASYGYEFTGISREEIKAGNQTVFIFLLSVFFVYFLLAAQYESYVLPLAVILTVPTGLLGVFAFIGFGGVQNNVYVQVGLIMLIGLIAKNAILIVEFAVQRRRAGHTLVEAALEAAHLRLRPILMTSFAFIVGMLPLIFTQGASAQGNHSIGWSAVGGMLSGVVLGIFLIPVLFVIFQYMQEKISARKAASVRTRQVAVQ